MKGISRRVRLLIVEDNPSDVVFLRYALDGDLAWPTEATFLEDGEAAINYVLARRSSEPEEIPDLVIMDLNLPKRDGVEVLKVIRSTEGWERVPVVVFSSAPEHVTRINLEKADIQAACLVTKPFDIDQYLQVTQIFRNCYEKTRTAKA